MRALALGTCRINGAADRSAVMRHVPHRVHCLPEIERLLDVIDGRLPPADLLHTLSQNALADILARPEGHADRIAATTSWLRDRRFDAYVIELSSARSRWARVGDDEVLLDSVVANSLAEHAAAMEPLYAAGVLRRLGPARHQLDDTAAVKAAMRRIKNRLAAPIVWVSHCSLPDPAPSEAHAARTRADLAEKTARFAAQMGDAFFDPTTLIQRFGRRAVFTRNGTDLFHYTDAALDHLAHALEARLTDQAIAA